MNVAEELTVRFTACAAPSRNLPLKNLPGESPAALDPPNDQGQHRSDHHPLDRSEDRRTHPRFSLDADSTLLLVNRGLSLPGRILDLSLDGCRLRTRERCPVPARARVEVAFKVNGIAFRFLGVVQWTDDRHCAGIRFVNMIARRREQLAEVIGEVKVAPAAGESAVRESAKPETRVAREAPSPPSILHLEHANPKTRQPLELHHPPVPKGDRRAQMRHSVDTVASILLVNIGARLSGRIVDLSTGGCRVLCDQRFPVGIYTRVEAEFSLDGLPFRLGGVVQAIHNQRTVGIRFLDMSLRKHAQIEQLIEEIEERENL